MSLDKYDITFAMKAIGLSEQLNGSDKRVAFAIIDHFNRSTGRCDPSRETISKLLNIAPRTVSRSLSKLTRTGLFKISRHGGHYNCNSYQPNWRLCRELEEVWKERRVACSRSFRGQELSSNPGRSCPLTADKPVHQTNSSNPILPTYAQRQRTRVQMERSLKLSNEEEHRLVTAATPSIKSGVTPSSSEAAKAAAEKRWNERLIERFGHDVSVYGQIVEAMTPQLQESVTNAELQRRGSGLIFLIKELSSHIPSLRGA